MSIFLTSIVSAPSSFFPFRATVYGSRYTRSGESKSNGSRKPTKQRGIYSEYLGASTVSSRKEASAGPRTNKNSNIAPPVQKQPKARKFKRGASVIKRSTGSAHHRSTSERDIEPKVIVPFKQRPGKPPRRIEIERKKRLYASQDLEELLRAGGIDYVKYALNMDHTSGQQSYLPIESFDDTEYECRYPTEWIQLGTNRNGECSINAKGLRFESSGMGHWVSCEVQAYEAKDGEGCFRIRWKDNNRVQYLHRIHLCFEAENPFVFARRVCIAHSSRRNFEAQIRYCLYVDSMPTDEIAPLDTEQVNRILLLALNTTKLKQNALDTTSLLNEVNIDYARTMNKIIFDVNLKDPNQVMLRDMLQMPETKEEKKTCSHLGVVSVPFHDFPKHFSDFCFHSFFTKLEAIRALVQVNEQCIELQSKSAFNTSINKTLRLEEYEQLQSAAMLQLNSYLKDKWHSALKNSIKNSLREVGKGWLNLAEENREVYQFSKLKKFMTMVNFMMQDSLQFCLEDSVRSYEAFLLKCSRYQVRVNKTYDVQVTDEQSSAPEANLIEQERREKAHADSSSEQGSRPNTSRTSTRPVPQVRSGKDWSLFMVELLLREDKIQYSVPVEDLLQTPLDLFDKALSMMHDIPQLEHTVMEQLFWHGSDAKLASVRKEEKWVSAIYTNIRDKLTAAMEPMKVYLDKFEKYKDFIDLDVEEFVKNWAGTRPDIEEIRKNIMYQLRQKAKIEYEIPKTIWLGIVTVNCIDVRRKLVDKRQEVIDKMLDLFASLTRMRCQEIINNFKKIEFELRKEPDDIQALVKIKDYMNGVPVLVAANRNPIRDAMMSFDVLDEFNYMLPNDLFRMKWNTYGWPRSIHDQMERKEIALANDKNAFLTEMRSQQEEFTAELLELENVVKTFPLFAEKNPLKKVQKKATEIHDKLANLAARAQSFNNDELLFNLNSTDYRHVARVNKQFDPFYNLFTIAYDWDTNFERWMSDSFLTLDGQEIAKSVTTYNKTMSKVLKVRAIKDNDFCFERAERVKKSLEEFRPYLPLIQALRNPGMRDRHWEELSKELPFEFSPDDSLTLEKIVKEFELQGYLDVITRVGDSAGQEYLIESALDKMENAWKGCEFVVKDYKKTQTYRLSSVEEIIVQLDEHLVTTQSMQYSAHKKPYAERISRWENKLKLVYEVIEEWLQVQRQWVSLQAIFASPDINKQLPGEGKRFQSVNKHWRLIMQQVHANPDVLSFCDNPSLLTKLEESNNLLQMVQKRLSDYLDKKRMAFARFYFLADEDLLQILSQTQDPTAVQPHLKKCFENINTLEFTDQTLIAAMLSEEGERIAFSHKLDPVKKNVEHWLNEVENEMKVSVKDHLQVAVEDYHKRPRSEWVMSWPGQCILAGSQIHFTMEVESALQAKGHDGIVEYRKLVGQQIDDMVELVRGELTEIQSIIMNALIVLDVHAREVVDRLVREKVNEPKDFAWICQLRYYQEQDGLMAQMVQSRFPYGYEYLGNTTRLVITPLTDRCYMTLMSALQLHLGGSPSGPAGTGKTETVKDLAKACGKQCVVFNCSDGLNTDAMSKFFKGLASSGAWACFDEFNRIDIEVLSVVAQQIMTIWAAVRAGKKIFEFDEVKIKLDPSCSVFITMNPGYAGRTELPDNLKALFRPVAMMVPDYALIGEIMFYSFGFNNAKILARKMVVTFRLCCEQLSEQSHYDYGMRSVKTVIVRAGILKREDPLMDESVLLLRALRDVNVPKFLKHDLPLFEGIISDLFPGIDKPEADYGPLMNALVLSARELDLQPVNPFLAKCIQLYETTVVRHGLMLVGPTGGGKTSSLRALVKSMRKLQILPGFEDVKVNTINPKAVTMGQLYGQTDPLTQEWTNGILAKIVRGCIADSADSPAKQWIVFDGPVDALWIENMNTVLDDNKKLCLPNAEILRLTPQMTMIFEVEDLIHASPATVSRCGMVYMQPSQLGYTPMVTSWIEGLHKKFANVKPTLNLMFDNLLAPAIEFVRKNCKEVVVSVDNNLAFSLMRLLTCVFAPYVPIEGVPITSQIEEETSTLLKNIESVFIMCLIWSVGATVNKEGRDKFSAYLRLQLSQLDMKAGPPKEGLVYDYLFSLTEKSWIGWMDSVPEFKFDNRLSYKEIIVPTVDSVRYNFFTDKLIKQDLHVLLTGETGTGKTVNAFQFLSGLNPEKLIPLTLIFSAATTANQIEDMFFQKLQKRRQRVWGPPLGRKFVVFVDDMNMPALEKYDAQPPIELLRQYMDHGGWYERNSPQLHFVDILNICFIGAMGPPSGGRNPVTNRFLRHFNQIAHTELDTSSCFMIFSTILQNMLYQFPDNIQEMATALTQATIDVYFTVSSELLPTPSKSHYTFNLRDLSAVFQGILSVSPRKVNTVPSFLRLWIHENQRVFEDRLINDTDRGWLKALLSKLLLNKFNVQWEDVVPKGVGVLFGDFMEGMGSEQRLYTEINDLQKCVDVIEESLAEYNDEEETGMKLVMFLDAIKHISRISRMLRQPGGNALLLGMGGSGRQSLTKLAAFMAEYELFQVEIAKNYGKTEWHDDLKRLLLDAGLKEQPTVFLLSDTQIVNEEFYQDVNSILNSGEVPNIYNAEDMDNIFATCKIDCQHKQIQPTKLNAYTQFVNRVRANLHVVLAMSPVGDAFRTRLRMFPALVNCCTIDWFSDWPSDALKSVANSSLTDEELRIDSIDAVQDMFMLIHESVTKKSVVYRERLRRYNYVTPTSYLELLNVFKFLLQEKRAEVGGLKNKLQHGLDTLDETSEQVADFQVELKELQPRLAITQKEVADTMVQIEVDTKAANETKAIVEKQEEDCSEKEQKCKQIRDEASTKLNAALPLLSQAVECLRELNRSHIEEVRNFNNPPKGVVLTMEAACIMLRSKLKFKVITKADPDNLGKSIPHYWDTAQKYLLKAPRVLLETLKKYDRDNIPERVIQRIEPYVKREDFQVKKIADVSTACRAICMWVHAMYNYHQVSKTVQPLRDSLVDAEKSLEKVTVALNETQGRLKSVENRLKALQDKYEALVLRSEKLADEVEQTQIKLERATRLIGGLGGEKTRWSEKIAELTIAYGNICGDVIVSAGTIAYLGAFTAQYRQELLELWCSKLAELKIPHTAGCSVRTTLADPVQIRAWNIAGLPTDSVSTENGIIMSKARQWPLMIDPQGQASKFIKNLGDEKFKESGGMDIVHLHDKGFLTMLENGIRFGRWILLSNIGETLDPVLEPLLLQQIVNVNGVPSIKVGDNYVTYNDQFHLYITTKLPNPHYAPELQVKVTLLNFTITPEGLEDQMLGRVVATESPEMEQKKSQLVVQNARMKKQLQDMEDEILRLLTENKGNLLDDEMLINTLAASKKTSEEINDRVAETEIVEKDIDASRQAYLPVAVRASVLYFCISSLASIDPMYQYSLNWFVNLFLSAISQAPTSNDLEGRLKVLNDYFTLSLYHSVCRSLFEAHKQLLSLMMAVRILMRSDQLDHNEFRFLVAGPPPSKFTKNPAPEWLSDNNWNQIMALSELKPFEGFDNDFEDHSRHYKRIYDSPTPETEKMPMPWDESLTQFQKLLFLKCLRPDKLTPAISLWVSAQLGDEFNDTPQFNISDSFNGATPLTPLIFVLSRGADPASALFAFANKCGFRDKFQYTSLGQGQGAKAKRMIEEAQKRGGWVLLQNCHLAVSWLPTLEQLIADIDEDTVHDDFRLWLTSLPTPKFPVSILQNGVKMTNEPPKGLRANLMRTYLGFTDTQLNKSKRPGEFKKLLYALCFFHAVILDRRKFGPLGWNIPYQFTDMDLQVCVTQLRDFIDMYDEIPYQVIHFLTHHINYGGRVTDPQDRRCIRTILDDFIRVEVMSDDFKFSPSGDYLSIPTGNREHYLKQIKTMNHTPSPEVFGMHENASITSAQGDTIKLCDTLLLMMPRDTGSGGGSREDVISETALQILEQIPEPWELDGVRKKYPTTYTESMNTVLVQEALRYNRLIVRVRKSLVDLGRALRGESVMSKSLEKMSDSLYNNTVPSLWEAVAYPSLMPLSSWVKDLLSRIHFIGKWIDDGIPIVFWISGFFFTHAFLTGTLQNYARKTKKPIDAISFGFRVLDRSAETIVERPMSGVYITGLWLEGCRWDAIRHSLVDSRPKELFSAFPVMWLNPEEDRKVKNKDEFYLCPVYRTLARRGQLSTTGHSTNFILNVEIPTIAPPKKWIKAGVAIFTALRYAT